MSHEVFEFVARLTKPIGLKGVIGAIGADDLDLSQAQNLKVWLVPPCANAPRELTIAEVKQQASGYQLRFANVSHIDILQDFAGRSLLAPAKQLLGLQAEPPAAKHAPKIVEERKLGCLGTIVDSYNTAAYTMWVINGDFGELLVPAVDDYIVRETDDIVELALPDGFIEAQQKGGSKC